MMSFIKKVLGARGVSKRGGSKRVPPGAMLPGRGKLPSLRVPLASVPRMRRPLGMPVLPRRRPTKRG